MPWCSAIRLLRCTLSKQCPHTRRYASRCLCSVPCYWHPTSVPLMEGWTLARRSLCIARDAYCGRHYGAIGLRVWGGSEGVLTFAVHRRLRCAVIRLWCVVCIAPIRVMRHLRSGTSGTAEGTPFSPRYKFLKSSIHSKPLFLLTTTNSTTPTPPRQVTFFYPSPTPHQPSSQPFCATSTNLLTPSFIYVLLALSLCYTNSERPSSSCAKANKCSRRYINIKG